MTKELKSKDDKSKKKSMSKNLSIGGSKCLSPILPRNPKFGVVNI